MFASVGIIAALGGGPSPGAVELAAEGCPQVDAAEVMRIVALETERSTSFASSSAASGAPGQRVELQCTDTHVSLRLLDTVTLRRLQREFQMESPEIRARHIGLEIVESLDTLAELPPSQEALEPVAAVVDGDQPSAAADVDRWWVGASASAALGGRPVHGRGGGGLFVIVRPRRWLAAGLELDARGGGRRVGPGRVDVVTVDATAVVGFGTAGRWGSVDAGPGVAAGGAWLRGRPVGDGVRGRVHAGTTWGPVVAARVGLAVRPRWRLRLGLKAGWTVRGIAGRDPTQVVLSTGGPWAALDVGLGVIF